MHIYCNLVVSYVYNHNLYPSVKMLCVNVHHYKSATEIQFYLLIFSENVFFLSPVMFFQKKKKKTVDVSNCYLLLYSVMVMHEEHLQMKRVLQINRPLWLPDESLTQFCFVVGCFALQWKWGQSSAKKSGGESTDNIQCT